jgi:histidinol dehydrogenase
MTAIPARVAGVPDVSLACPPGADGKVNQTTLAAAALAGVDRVIALGGAQAIAALAYGLEDLDPVDVIVGPGNLWVTLAKMEVAHRVRVDGFQGPTEIVIIADETMPALFAATDLVAQAEHDPLATCILITPDEALAKEVQSLLPDEVAAHPRPDDVGSALRDHGRIILTDDLEHACRVSDAFAPEHLELAVAAPERLLARIRHAGAIFCGPYSPVSLGDYLAGTNHVLPTAGSARFTSPLRVGTFLKQTGIISFGPSGLERVAPALQTIATAEGLVAHGRAVEVRTQHRP